MKTLLIYDNEGYILSSVRGTGGVDGLREPIGVPFMWVDIPEGKQLNLSNGIGVDTSKTPHEPIFVEVPKHRTDALEEKINAQEQAIAELTMMISMGM